MAEEQKSRLTNVIALLTALSGLIAAVVALSGVLKPLWGGSAENVTAAAGNVAATPPAVVVPPGQLVASPDTVTAPSTASRSARPYPGTGGSSGAQHGETQEPSTTALSDGEPATHPAPATENPAPDESTHDPE